MGVIPIRTERNLILSILSAMYSSLVLMICLSATQRLGNIGVNHFSIWYKHFDLSRSPLSSILLKLNVQYSVAWWRQIWIYILKQKLSVCIPCVQPNRVLKFYQHLIIEDSFSWIFSYRQYSTNGTACKHLHSNRFHSHSRLAHKSKHHYFYFRWILKNWGSFISGFRLRITNNNNFDKFLHLHIKFSEYIIREGHIMNWIFVMFTVSYKSIVNTSSSRQHELKRHWKAILSNFTRETFSSRKQWDLLNFYSDYSLKFFLGESTGFHNNFFLPIFCKFIRIVQFVAIIIWLNVNYHTLKRVNEV